MPRSVATASRWTNFQLAATAAVFRKELRDGLRERRAMAMAFLFGPLLGPVAFSVFISFAISQQVDEALEPITVPVIGGERAPNLMAYLHSRLIDVDGDRFQDADALREAVRRGEVDVGLTLDENFGEALASGAPALVWMVSDRSNNAARAAAARTRAILTQYNSIIGSNRLALRGVDRRILQPLAILSDDVSTPSGRAILLLGMMTYFLLFSTLLGGMQVAIDTTAGERERGTLEPLLTLPVSRGELVLGKFATALLFMAASLALAIVSFAVAASFLPLAEIGMTANFSPATCAMMYLAMLPFAVFGTGALMLMASYAKNFREAQTYTSIAMLVPPLPVIVAVLNPIQASTELMLVPSLSQHLLITSLIKGEPIDPLHFAVSAGVTMAGGVCCLLATVRRYRSERLLL